MLVFVKAVEVYAEERIWQPSGKCWVGESAINDDGHQQGERWRPAPFAAAFVSISRPNDTIMISVPVFDMLLNHLDMRVRRIEYESGVDGRDYLPFGVGESPPNCSPSCRLVSLGSQPDLLARYRH